jgi:hypothetical protein
MKMMKYDYLTKLVINNYFYYWIYNKNNISIMNSLIEWKWSKGMNYDRSRRINKESIDENFNKIVENSAYKSSLNHDENTWEIMNNNLFDKDFVQYNKREDRDKKLSERQMMCQVNMNPYLTNNSYVQDLSIHDQFMKPISTNNTLDMDTEQAFNAIQNTTSLT